MNAPSLDRLLASQGHENAHEMLAEVYCCLDESFDPLDLKTPKRYYANCRIERHFTPVEPYRAQERCVKSLAFFYIQFFLCPVYTTSLDLNGWPK